MLGAGGPPTPACFMTLGCLCHGSLGTSVLLERESLPNRDRKGQN